MLSAIRMVSVVHKAAGILPRGWAMVDVVYGTVPKRHLGDAWG